MGGALRAFEPFAPGTHPEHPKLPPYLSNSITFVQFGLFLYDTKMICKCILYDPDTFAELKVNGDQEQTSDDALHVRLFCTG